MCVCVCVYMYTHTYIQTYIHASIAVLTIKYFRGENQCGQTNFF